jgi:hypothetical protein
MNGPHRRLRKIPKTYIGIAFQAANDYYELKPPRYLRRQRVGR